MTPTNSRLLRRTALAVAAAVGMFASLATEAAVVTLTGANGSTCSYSTMSITPDGNVTVQCSGSTTPTPTPTPSPGPAVDAGAFSIGVNQALVNIGDGPLLTVFRSGSATGAVNVPFSLSGTACSGSGSANFSDGQNQSSFVVVPTAGGTCNVSLGTPSNSGARLGSPAAVAISVNGPVGTPTPGPTPTPAPGGVAGCAAPPADMLSASFKPIGAVLLQMQKSGQVVSMPLPDVSSHSGQAVFSESAGGAFTPQPVTLTVSISKCPGIIDTDQSNSCNMVSTNGNYNAMTWFASPYSVIQDATSARQYSFCWAPRSEGQWYVNARWTYSNCAFGAAVCGFAIQQNQGSY